MARQPYPSDLASAQWQPIAPPTPPVEPGGRPRKYDPREVVNGLLYVDREGCRWRARPHDLPHRKTAHNFLRSSAAGGTWGRPVAALRVEVRTKLGRDPTPSGGRIDSPSAKAAHGGGAVGADGGKTVRGRERRIVTGTLGPPPVVPVTAANSGDGETAPGLLAESRPGASPRLAVLWADSKHRDHNLDAWLAGQSRLRVEVTTKPDGQKGSKPPPKRRVAEQALAHLTRPRRPVRDCERLPGTSAAMVKLSRVHRMARRARPPRGGRRFRYKPNTAA